MFSKRLISFRRNRSRTLIVLLGLVVLAQHPLGVSAAIRSCRADPIVWLSNGDSVQMTVEIGADAADVRSIHYTLHAPVGATIDRIVYTGGALQSKEAVFFVADQPAGQYISDTVVTTRGKRHVVTANTNESGTFRGSVSGYSGEHLFLHFNSAP